MNRGRDSPLINHIPSMSERTSLRKGYFIINGVVLQSLCFLPIQSTLHSISQRRKTKSMIVQTARQLKRFLVN